MRARALLLVLLVTGCEVEPPSTAPSRILGVHLHSDGQAALMRSQPAGEHFWSGRQNETVAVQMTAPVTARSVVTPQLDGSFPPPEEVYVFLDGAGELGDTSRELDSTLTFEERILPSTYNVLVAPDGLMGRHPARLITPVTFQSDTPAANPLDWSLPATSLVNGVVVTWSTNQPVPDAVVSVFRATEPRLPVGVTVLTDASGAFAFEVPEGTYDIVISGPSDGSVPIPPVRLLNQRLPLFQGVLLRAEVPVVPVVPVRGRLARPLSEESVVGRVRLEGRLDDGLNGASGILMGRYQVEFETESDGSFEIDLPAGDYSALAIPRYDRVIDTQTGLGHLEFEVPFGATSVQGLIVPMETTASVRIEAYNPGGAPMVGATIVLRMKEPPRYSWSVLTGGPDPTGQGNNEFEGAFAGQVIAGEYDIELIPPPDADGNARLARVQATALLKDNVVVLQALRSDRVQGFVFTQGEASVPDVHVMVRDPDTGALWDSTLSRKDEFDGVFEVVVPR